MMADHDRRGWPVIMRRILVTGSRHWTDGTTIRAALARILDQTPEATLVTGGCPTGADAIAERYWSYVGAPIERHPADWKTCGRRAGPIRNQEMVDLGADVCLAFPLPDSVGTFDCMRRAEKAGIPVINYGPGEGGR